MKRSVLVALMLFCCVLVLESGYAAEVIWEEVPTGETDCMAVTVHPANPRIIFMGNNHGIFRSEDAGKSWRNVLSVRGQNRSVNFLLFDPQDLNSVYAATGSGLFVGRNKGRSWRRIFRGKDSFERECASVAVLSGEIYLGTAGGLFISGDKGRSWVKAMGKLGDSRIFAIAFNLKQKNIIYAASSEGVFSREDNQDDWERIFIPRLTENGGDTEDNADGQEEEGRSDIKYIACSPDEPDSAYLATSRGVYLSRNKGKEWSLLTDYGLLSRCVRFLLISGKRVYSATQSGVFEYNNDRWREVSFELAAGEVRFLAADNKGTLYAACQRGLFKIALDDSTPSNRSGAIEMYSDGEPGISGVQKAAIKYAEVYPEKIKLWRRQAAVKAILPRVSAGVGRDTVDLWHWEGGSSVKANDDILVKGKDALDWDVTLTWDLSEIIWNPDQTSIDVRSKLMVQLRDDIVDEVTKLYFERLRVKMEMDGLAIEDWKKRAKKELRLQELTASIDGLTGGYFSRHLPHPQGRLPVRQAGF